MNLAKRNISNIERLETLNAKRPQVEIDTIERFIGSMYVREIIIPKDCTITSRVYKRSYVDIMVSGDITITDSNGTYRLTGFNLLEGTSGRKRAGYAHEETRWITVHDSFDIVKNPLEDISLETLNDHDKFRAEEDKKSFQLFLEKNNLDTEIVKSQSEIEAYNPINGDYYLDDSAIHGKGVFTSRPFRAGETIGPIAIEGVKTQLGRYVNHSKYPNVAHFHGDLIAIRCIDSAKEMLIDYNISERI